MNDAEMLAFLRAEFPEAGIARATVAKDADKTTIQFHASRPGIVIGRRGVKIGELKEKLEAKLGTVHLDLFELRRAELEPLLVADQVLSMLRRGIALERALEIPLAQSVKAGARGGRLGISGAIGEHERFAGDFSESNSLSSSVTGATEEGDVTVEIALTLKAPDPAAL